MKKDDLRANDIITTRIEGRFMLHRLNGEDYMSDSIGYIRLCNYGQDLKHDICSNLDIVKVSRPNQPHQLSLTEWGDAPVIWERREPKKMTLEEISEALGYDVEIMEDDND